MLSVEEVISLLELKPLPLEGGFYRETYRSTLRLPTGKSTATAIYYLLTPETFSALHRLPTDEVFHFYLGSPVRMLQLGPAGEGRVVTLGTDLQVGHAPQVVVPAGVWQGSYLEAGPWALLGTTMAPGFDFTDYEAGSRDFLIDEYPQFADLVRRLTAS
jgi:predicted cupin superfamily sugar epimerase